MKHKKELFIALIWIIAIIIIGIIVWKTFTSLKQDTKNNSIDDNSISYRYITIKEDNTKINNSSKLLETKTFDGLSFSDFELSEKSSISTLKGTITNVSDTTQSSRYFDCHMINENNEEYYVLTIYLNKDLAPNESTTFSSAITIDNIDIYDFYIVTSEE